MAPVIVPQKLPCYMDAVSQTSRALHLHRSSLIDRLNRIENILKTDLNDPDERLILQIVLHMK